MLLKCVNGGGDVIIFQLKMERINEMDKGGWCLAIAVDSGLVCEMLTPLKHTPSA